MPRLALPPKKKKAAKTPAALETADDYLAAGIDYEEAGEKHRAGDAVKSARAFLRAVQTYSQGLDRYPNNFDLAYNIARIQYTVTQNPALFAHFPISLAEAFKWHKRALDLDPSNNDVLFNTAQVMSSLAESLAGRTEVLPFSKIHGLPIEGNPQSLLEASIRLFEQCLARQEVQYMESAKQQESFSTLQEDNGGVLLDQTALESATPTSSTSQDTPEEQWASIVEPVTAQTLLDTVCALIETLGTTCAILAPTNASVLTTTSTIVDTLLFTKLPVYLEHAESNAQIEAWLTIAHFRTAHLEASYRVAAIDVSAYESALADTYAKPLFAPSDLVQTSAYLISHADALIAFNGALSDNENNMTTSSPNNRWTALTSALTLLTSASKAPDAANVPEIHIGRGDVELLRLQVTFAPGLSDSLANDKTRATLLRNAETYYRGAINVAKASVMYSQAPVVGVARVKRGVVEGLMGRGMSPLKQLVQGPDMLALITVKEVVGDMEEEGLLTAEQRVLVFGA